MLMLDIVFAVLVISVLLCLFMPLIELFVYLIYWIYTKIRY